MLKEKERQIVLDCLYQESLVVAKQHTNVLEDAQRTAKLEAKLKLDHLSDKQKIYIYYNFISKQITKYIAKDMRSSNTMYWVNGSPKKRDMRIEEYARYAYARMPTNQKIAICEKLNYKYIEP